jgi:hypothetical protein
LRGSLFPRIALAVVAVLLITWSAVLWRDEHVGRQAADRIFSDPVMSDSEWDRFLAQLRDAQLLDPSTKWAVSRATALLLRDEPEAARVAASVVAREPDNLEAWMVVLKATRGRDAARADRARAEIRRLNPPPPDR